MKRKSIGRVIGITALVSCALGGSLSACASSGAQQGGAEDAREARGGAAQSTGELKLAAGEKLQVFLLIGQSNMEGVPKPEAADLEVNPRVWVLGYDECKGRHFNQWTQAQPPLHHCAMGVGPGDSFGKAIAKAWSNATIGLVPAAIAGVDVDFFRKGVVSARRKEFKIPPDDHYSSAYDMLIERAKIAQQVGTIRGILWHQGESDNTRPEWPRKVAQIVEDLRTDLGLPVSVPFLAGELLYSGCCAAHNSRVNELPQAIPDAHVISAQGLAGMDPFHFNLAGQRELGTRYAEKFLELWPTP